MRHRCIVWGSILAITQWLFFLTAPLSEQLTKYVPKVFAQEPTLAMACVLLLLLIPFFLVLSRLRHTSEAVSFRVVLVFSVLLALPYFLIAPQGSTDVYSYGYFGHLVQTHKSPFSPQPDSTTDVFYMRTKALHPFPSPYGPIALFSATGVRWIAGNHIEAGVLVFRLLHYASLLACAWLLVRIAKNRKLATVAAITCIWNPYVLFEVVNNAHNDSLMILFLFFGVYAFEKRKYLWVFPAVALAVMVKSLALVAVPVFLLALLQKKAFKRGVFYGGVIALASAVILFLPLWQGMTTLQPLLALQGTFHMPAYHPLAVFNSLFGFFHLASSTTLARIVGMAFFFPLAALLLWEYRKGRQSIHAALFWFFLATLGLLFGFFQPWYMLTPLLLAPIALRKHSFWAILFLSTLGVLTYALY